MGKHHFILVLEGGGAKGPIHVGELTRLEERMNNEPIINHTDLLVTTSIGAVEGSVYVTGMRPKEFWVHLEPNLKKIFTSKYPWSIPRYRFDSYIDLYSKIFGKNIKFGESLTKMIMTSVGMTDKDNHFFKTWHEKDAKHYMCNMACRSFAAPLYFGGINDLFSKQVWMDGGTGFCNLPLIEAYAEAVAQGWLSDGNTTHILALGCGSRDYRSSYKECTKGGKLRESLRQIKVFMNQKNGGLARVQSTSYQVNTMGFITKNTPSLTFQWVNWFPMPKKLDVMNNWKARWDYYNKGVNLGLDIDIDPIIEHKKEYNDKGVSKIVF